MKIEDIKEANKALQVNQQPNKEIKTIKTTVAASWSSVSISKRWIAVIWFVVLFQGGQVWLKDKEASHCKLCEKEFSISRRKVSFTDLCVHS